MHGVIIRVSSLLRLGSKTLDILENLFSPTSLRSYLAEFISTFIFVFAGVGSVMSAGKLMTPESLSAETDLLPVALAHAFAFFVAAYVASSGGHANPAVTLGLVVKRHISISIGICYCVAQLLGSTIACLFLMLVTAGQAVPTHELREGMTGFGGMVMESIATFTLVYTVCVVRDPQNGSSDGIVGSMAIGFMLGANILATGAFTDGSMNPARSFGPAIITGDFQNHWIYWFGPLIGGALAGFFYLHFMSHANDHSHASSTTETL